MQSAGLRERAGIPLSGRLVQIWSFHARTAATRGVPEERRTKVVVGSSLTMLRELTR